MSDEADDSGTPHPRESLALFGHADAEQTLLDAYRSGRIPHAWLIGGPRGIGKATLAYRLARFVLAHPDSSAPEVQKAASLAVAEDNPAARRIASESHSDLLALERGLNDKGKLRQDIAVDDVRRSVSFFGSTAGEGGWRVAIVDSVDELNAAGANALLKVIEEPPARSLLLLISHAPGRVLPTIRSRCRRLLLRPLEQAEVAQAAANALGRSASDPDIVEAAAASDGSVDRALALLDGPALALRQKVLDALGQLPNPDPRALHALGDALAGSESRPLTTFVDIVNGWLSARLKGGTAPVQRMARLGQIWDEINTAARDVEIFNLDRRPLVFSVFGLLAEASRG
jgi:DNA polymerase-3 subunit delta'